MIDLSINEAAELLRRKEISPVDLANACLDRIERLNPVLNAFITVTHESAMAQARLAEDEIQRGQWRGPLHGIPVGLKDLIDTAGVRTTCGSVGLKPTYGRVSTRGVFPLSWSLDHVGPICRNVKDAALMLEAIAGYDRRDVTCVDWPKEEYSNALSSQTDFRIGLVRQPFFADLDREIELAINEPTEVIHRMSHL